MATPFIGINDSSFQVRDVNGSHNELYYAKISLNFNDLSLELKQTIENGARMIMRDQLIHEVPVERPALAVEGTAVLALHEPLQELAKALHREEVDNMITMFCMACQVQTKPASAQDLFASLIHNRKLSLQDFTFLQSLLWKAGRRDLFKILAERARELEEIHEEDDPPLKISHLDAPSLVPIEGYSYVKFHLKVDLLDIGPQRLGKLEKELAELLGVPRRFVAVVGVEPDQSAWVTVAMPAVACRLLQLQFDKGGVQNFLLTLDINQVGFLPNPDIPVNPGKQSVNSALEAQSGPSFIEQGGIISVKEGRQTGDSVVVTFKLEDMELETPPTPKPQSVRIPVGLLKEEMEDMLDMEAQDMVWLYEGKELDDNGDLDHQVEETATHIEILVRKRAMSESD